MTPLRPLPLALLAALLVGVWPLPAGQKAKPDADIDDLALIPADAQGFLSVRVADLWKTPAVQKGVKEAKNRDPKIQGAADRMEKAFGLKPAEVERVSAVYSAEGHAWGVVRTVEPYDRRTLLSRLDGARQGVHLGNQFHTGTDDRGRRAAVWLASPRVVVVGPEEGVKRCIALAAAPLPEGPLQPIISRCKQKYHAVVGIDGRRLDGLKGSLILSWVTPIRLAWATVAVDRDIDLWVHAEAGDEEQAEELNRNATTAIRLAPLFLANKIHVDVASALSSLVGGVKAVRIGRRVSARSRDEADLLIPYVLLLACGSSVLDEDVLVRVRSPFGVHGVEEGPTTKDGYLFEGKRLLNGTTTSGKQFTGWVRELFRDTETNKIVHGPRTFVPGVRDTPLAYYHATGPVGQVFRAYNTDPKRAFAVLELGTGTMASYGLPGQAVDFYDRDPELARITFDTDEYFTFVEDARRRGVAVHLVLGDPRSTFARKGVARRLKPLRARKGESAPAREVGEPVMADLAYRLILVDTLDPSDVPGRFTGRITREAVQGYFDRLESDGIVLIHISSRYFDLLPVLANIADDLGVVGYHLSDDDNDVAGKNRSHWVALTRKQENMAKVLTVPRWTRDREQLALLGVAGWPTGGSAALQSVAGMGHLGQVLTDLHARRVHEAEGRSGDPQGVRTGWGPLPTTADLRRVAAAGPKRIRDLTARIDALRKELDGLPTDTSKKAGLAARIASVEAVKKGLESKVERCPEMIRRNAKVGVWTDESSDLVELTSR